MGCAGASAQVQPAPQLANPASQNCVTRGGMLRIERRPDGGQFGVCVFTDNYQCEEWAMFRGECPVGRPSGDGIHHAGRALLRHHRRTLHGGGQERRRRRAGRLRACRAASPAPPMLTMPAPVAGDSRYEGNLRHNRAGFGTSVSFSGACSASTESPYPEERPQGASRSAWSNLRALAGDITLLPILRDASLRDAPQDEVVRFHPLAVCSKRMSGGSFA